jgi:hypothetical protein
MRKIYILILIIFLNFIYSYPVIAIGNVAIDSQITGGNVAVDSQITGGNVAVDSQITGNSSINYTVLVDQMHGFHAAYKPNKNGGDILVKNYQNNTLNINIGDTIFWSNDAVPDTQLSIMSYPVLWENITCGQNLCSYLGWDYKKFGYTFNKPGKYEIYIREFPIFNQTIIVGPIKLLSNPSPTPTPTPSAIKNNDSGNITTPIPTISPTPKKMQNSILNNTNSAVNAKSFSIGSDTIILTIVLFSMVVLSGRIKEEDE